MHIALPLHRPMHRYNCEAKERTKGTWAVQGVFVVLALYIGALIYNGLQNEEDVTAGMLATDLEMGRILACIAWFFDITQVDCGHAARAPVRDLGLGHFWAKHD